MTECTLDAGLCRLKTTIMANRNEYGNIDISVRTLCPDISKIMNNNILPQNIDPHLILEIKTAILPECIFTCSTVPNAGCPFIFIAYRVIESEARLAVKHE